jgi:hypothetical protein
MTQRMKRSKSGSWRPTIATSTTSLCAEQAKLEVFEPVMKHAIDDNKPPVVFHFQLVQDFLMVEEIAGKVLSELKRVSE